jgi:hypothetical protein
MSTSNDGRVACTCENPVITPVGRCHNCFQKILPPSPDRERVIDPYNDPVFKSIEAEANEKGLDTWMKRQHYGDFLTIVGAMIRRSYERGQASPATPTESEGVKAMRTAWEKTKKAVLALNYDGHDWSTRPCETCREITKSIGEPFRCNAKAKAAYAKERAGG